MIFDLPKHGLVTKLVIFVEDIGWRAVEVEDTTEGWLGLCLSMPIQEYATARRIGRQPLLANSGALWQPGKILPRHRRLLGSYARTTNPRAAACASSTIA